MFPISFESWYKLSIMNLIVRRMVGMSFPNLLRKNVVQFLAQFRTRITITQFIDKPTYVLLVWKSKYTFQRKFIIDETANGNKTIVLHKGSSINHVPSQIFGYFWPQPLLLRPYFRFQLPIRLLLIDDWIWCGLVQIA